MLEHTTSGLLATFCLGIFILIGILLTLFVKNKEKVTNFSLGLALGVISMLIIVDILPEIIDNLGLKYIYIFIIFTSIGLILFKLLDLCISNLDNNNLFQLSITTTIAIILHNIIEGAATYSVIVKDASMGVLMMIGIGFHNIPLGIIIGNSLKDTNTNKKKNIILIICVIISTFIGGLIMYLLKITTINPIIMGTLLSITTGMLLFIIFNELIPKIKKIKDKKDSIIGLLIGIMVLLISIMI